MPDSLASSPAHAYIGREGADLGRVGRYCSHHITPCCGYYCRPCACPPFAHCRRERLVTRSEPIFLPNCDLLVSPRAYTVNATLLRTRQLPDTTYPSCWTRLVWLSETRGLDCLTAPSLQRYRQQQQRQRNETNRRAGRGRPLLADATCVTSGLSYRSILEHKHFTALCPLPRIVVAASRTGQRCSSRRYRRRRRPLE